MRDKPREDFSRRVQEVDPTNIIVRNMHFAISWAQRELAAKLRNRQFALTCSDFELVLSGCQDAIVCVTARCQRNVRSYVRVLVFSPHDIKVRLAAIAKEWRDTQGRGVGIGTIGQVAGRGRDVRGRSLDKIG